MWRRRSVACSVVGALLPTDSNMGAERLRLVYQRSRERGRGTNGLEAVLPDGRSIRWYNPDHFARGPYAAVGNLRGEPTTEWQRDKTGRDVQPFASPTGRWVYTHNGTIANDHEICTAAGFTYPHPLVSAPAEQTLVPTLIDSYAIGVALDRYGWPDALHHLKGSFAILAIDNQQGIGTMFWAANYKPLWCLGSFDGSSTLFASQRSYFDDLYHPLGDPSPFALGPYEYGTVSLQGRITRHSLYSGVEQPQKTLVVCSGGLDSSVAAWSHYRQGDEVTLFHVLYGCKAENPETRAIEALAKAMGGSPTLFVETDFFTTVADSVLTRAGGKVNHSQAGVAGAELAHEWVPARNLVMFSLALAAAERHGFDVVSFGMNLEEAGAYPDNEPELLNLLQQVVPYAVRPYQRIAVASPVATLMKSEIVAYGHELEAPFELSWSCYEAGEVHCGTCGPCFLRRTAFEMVGVSDPTKYLH
jgi:7-cyano-7-deazaguanine synthase